MNLFVLRHAIAVPRGTSAYARIDSERPLTEKGIERMRRVARGMAQMSLAFDLILCSPYRRARETAEIVVDCFDTPELLELFEPLAAEIPAETALHALAKRCENLDSALVVGHEPQLSTIGAILLSGNPHPSLRLKKGGLFKLELDRVAPQAATLEWWLTPWQLRHLGSP